MDEPVTTTEIYQVAPGWESDFSRWGKALLQELERSSSFLGGEVVEPGRAGGDWHLVHRWTDSDIAVRWLESGARARWLEDAAEFARPRRPGEPVRDPMREPTRELAYEPKREVARESMRAPVRAPMLLVPAPAEQAEPPPASPTPPPKWKTAVVTLIAVFPPVLFFNVTLIPQLRAVNVVIRTLVLCIGVTAVVTWVMMPRLMPLFRGWLNKSSGQRARNWRGGTVPATIDGRVQVDAEIPTRRPAALGAARAETPLLASADSFTDQPDAYRERNSSRGGRARYLHQPSPDRRDPR